MPKLIGPKMHGVIDYLSVLLLLTAGPLFGFDGLASQITSTLAGAVLVYSAATAYPPGIVRLISFRAHLVIDTILGVAMIVMPWITGFGSDGKARFFFVAYGLFALIIVALTKSDTGRVTGRAESPS